MTICDELPDPAEPWLDHEYMAAIDVMDESAPTLEEVRCMLSGISGNLSDSIGEERDAGDNIGNLSRHQRTGKAESHQKSGH